MFDNYLIEHCSPTLANLKTANLFRLSGVSKEELEIWAEERNREMGEKGITILPLTYSNGSALIYVCRKKRLKMDWEKDGVLEYLTNCGYCDFTADGAIRHLAGRICESQEFPHEIGLFLGYPLADVVGFVENKGKNCLCTGFWKVYGDEQEAKKQFARYQKCREIYARLFENGRSLGKLTVAA